MESEAVVVARKFLAQRAGEAVHHAPFRELMALLGPDAVTEQLVRKASGAQLPLAGLASFRRSLSMRSRGRSLTGLSQEWPLNNKVKAYRFAELCGVPFPRTLQAGSSVDALAHDAMTPVVIKPEQGAGANGVYLVFDQHRIRDVARRQWLESWSEMIAAMRARLESGRLRKDSWIVEQLVLEDTSSGVPGRDLKFYCFYGEVGLVLEVKRDDGLQYCEWDGQGREVFSGKYDHVRFSGEGVTPEQLALASRMSAEIPAPFLRLDFLRSELAPAGMVFGEVTPRPGNYHAFNDEVDRVLGELYLAAEARLLHDLVARKKVFTVYDQALGR
ncbi:MAG: hypothetical protein JJU06_03520 [Ectothiorhodospiraceae bacterium]|nr:hypothetical protein [Ectothiorhodospiraceae bacterium]